MQFQKSQPLKQKQDCSTDSIKAQDFIYIKPSAIPHLSSVRQAVVRRSVFRYDELKATERMLAPPPRTSREPGSMDRRYTRVTARNHYWDKAQKHTNAPFHRYRHTEKRSRTAVVIKGSANDDASTRVNYP